MEAATAWHPHCWYSNAPHAAASAILPILIGRRLFALAEHEVNVIPCLVFGNKDVRDLQFFAILEWRDPGSLTTYSARRIIGELIPYQHKPSHYIGLSLHHGKT